MHTHMKNLSYNELKQLRNVNRFWIIVKALAIAALMYWIFV